MNSFHQKLDDAAAELEAMGEATSFTVYRRRYDSFLSDLRSAWWAMETEVKRSLRRSHQTARVPEFNQWLKAAAKSIEADPLLRWAKEGRDSNIHEGDGGLSASFYAADVNTADFGPPPHPDAALVARTDGFHWKIPGPPPRYIPIVAPGSVLHVYAEKPPTEHLGSPITDASPSALCFMALDYYNRLVGSRSVIEVPFAVQK